MDAVDGILPKVIYFASDLKSKHTRARTNYGMSYGMIGMTFERWMRGFVFEASEID